MSKIIRLLLLSPNGISSVPQKGIKEQFPNSAVTPERPKDTWRVYLKCRPTSHKLCFSSWGSGSWPHLLIIKPLAIGISGARRPSLGNIANCSVLVLCLIQYTPLQSSNDMFWLLVIHYLFIYIAYMLAAWRNLRDQNLIPKSSLQQIYSDLPLLMGWRAWAYLQLPVCGYIAFSECYI